MQYIFVILIGYLLGCSSMAWYLGRIKHAGIQANGTGNLGASNVTVLLGWRAGVLTALHDIGKAVLAVLLVRRFFPSLTHGPELAGVACVLGHIFPFWLRFRGGKGFASFWGMTLALNWRLALIIALAAFLITVITDYIVWGTVTTVVSVPLYLGLTGSHLTALILLTATGIMLYKHRENFRRIRSGTELGLRSAIRGDNRLKQHPPTHPS